MNPLIPNRLASFLLYEVHDAEGLCSEYPAFSDHGRDTFDLFVDSARRLARDVLYPTYRTMDESPPVLADGRVTAHPAMHEIYPRLVELGVISATRSYDIGGQQLPQTVATMALMYPMAANLSAASYVFLTTGAAHLIESFGSPELKAAMMTPMYEGRWTGTMALTEPQAGSSLGDITTTARPFPGTGGADGRYRLRGSKIFISGGDQDLTENIVHMTLARIEGAPAGSKGVSLFAVPRLRRGPDGDLVDNDVRTSQAIHKIGWRGLPSLALNYGEEDDCVGWLVGQPHRGLSYMFQMMNEARIMVGAHGIATASVAYQESLSYARERPQGRALGGPRDPSSAQIPIVEHADVRRMLLRQKAIVEGGMSLLLATSRLADEAAFSGCPPSARHAAEPACKEAGRLLDLLTPIAKSFPAEWGFESNALALQIHGGYGYTSEYLPEAWLRDQKLNSIHEGTTGIQGLDLLGRKVMAGGGEALRILGRRVSSTLQAARAVGADPAGCDALEAAVQRLGQVTMLLGAKGMAGDVKAMLLHSADYLSAASIVCVAWQWCGMAAAASRGLADHPTPADELFYTGSLAAARYWFATELPRAHVHLDLCASGEPSYGAVDPASL